MKMISTMLCAALLVASGCGTIDARSGGKTYPGVATLDGQRIQKRKVYPAVHSDCLTMRENHFLVMDQMLALHEALFLDLFSVLDLPISAVTDTLCLPYDLLKKEDSNQLLRRTQ